LEPIGFILGVLTFGTAITQKKVLRKAAVYTASQLISIFEGLKVTAFSLKEEIEDVIAEAQYENIKKLPLASETEEKLENNQIN
jgi:hypothetical protein